MRRGNVRVPRVERALLGVAVQAASRLGWLKIARIIRLL